MRDGSELVTVRAIEPEKRMVDVPGGFLDVGEHPVQWLRREEPELEVEGNPVLLATHTYGPEAWVLAIGFRARIVEGEPRPADEVRWISAGEWTEFVRAALQGAPQDER